MPIAFNLSVTDWALAMALESKQQMEKSRYDIECFFINIRFFSAIAYTRTVFRLTHI